MSAFCFGIASLFNHDRRPVYMRDGKWTVRECLLSGETFGPVLFETDIVTSMCAWLNNNEVKLEPNKDDYL